MNHPARLNRRFCLLACPLWWEKGGWRIPAANRRGSILIWSVLLGFLLTSVFFFFSMRQRATITVQRDTVAILNAKAYLESYADYLEKNPTESPDASYDDMQGSLTQKVNDIEGSAETSVPVSYIFTNKEIYVEWNKCSENMEGDLKVNNVIYKHDAVLVCDPTDEGYDDVIGPITVTNPEITTLNAPFYYHITGTDLTDNKWHLELSTELHFGKKIRVKKTF